MYSVKKIALVLTITIISSTSTNAQQQNHIPWPSLAGSPWPYLRGDMQCTGRSQFVGPGTNNIIWRKDMPFGVESGPVIGYDDVLFMGERDPAWDTVNYFYAIDKNGEDLWTYLTPTVLPNQISPIINNDSTIYFGSTIGLYALSADGNLKWEYHGNVYNSPGLTITLAKSGNLYIPQYDTLLIMDKYGNVQKLVEIIDLTRIAVSFSTGGDTIFYFTGGNSLNPGSLQAANLNGELLWSYDFANHNWGTILVDNQNKCYVFGTDSIAPGNRYLYCIKPDGTMDWRYKIPGYNSFSSPTIDKNGNIIFHTVLQYDSIWHNSIVSLDYYGNLNWFTPLTVGDFTDNYIDHALVCDVEGKIYCGSGGGGNFYCLNSSGEILWRIDLGYLTFESSPAIGSDGTLYIGTLISGIGSNEDNLIAVRDTVTSVQTVNQSALGYSLEQNYPNPFNPTTTIEFSIESAGMVTLKAYDILGREVATLVNEMKGVGNFSVEFNASNLPSGIYVYRITSGNFVDTKKLILLK